MAEPTAPSELVTFDSNKTHVSAPTSPQVSDGWVLNEIPTSAVFNYLMNAIGLWLVWLKAKLAIFPGYSADSTLTISGGSVTPTKGNHNIETVGGGATSDLSNIATTNLDDGRMLVITCLNPSHIVVVKHTAGGAGQIHLNDGLDYSLNSLSAILTLKRIGADWYEANRSMQSGGAVVGEMKAFPGSVVPAGYLLCDGSAVSRSVYSSLFSVLSTAWGVGDGSTTFNIPNMKGRILRGLASYVDATCTGLPGSNNATFAGHPYRQSGIRVRLTGGSLGGLVTATDYWVIYIDANTLAFASTFANALAGTKISLSANSAAVISQWEDTDATTRTASTVGGDSGQNIGSLQTDASKKHQHTVLRTSSGGGGNGLEYVTGTQAGVGDEPTTTVGAEETRPLNIAVNYIIKY